VSEGPARLSFSWLLLLVTAFSSGAEVLPLPTRPLDAPNGSRFVERIAALPLADRELQIATEILRGNVPQFLRKLHPVTMRTFADGRTTVATFLVTPDYLAIGSDEDYFLCPMTPLTAQRIADSIDCVLPTPRMVDAIYAAAELKLTPLPISPSPAMTSVSIFAQHNAMVRTQRVGRLMTHPLGTLVAGHKKDVVISKRLTNAPGKVAIYGWHKLDGKPIQPLYTGHTNSWVDYSQCVRLVRSTLLANDKPNTVAGVLNDPRLASLLSDEGVISSSSYSAPAVRAQSFDEQLVELSVAPGVRVMITSPVAGSSTAKGPVKLVLYALPNGNTIEQTAGRRLRPGDDWHFDIQHIAAQTRFIRAADTNHQWVIAYLETTEKSWPAWRKKHSDEGRLILELVGRIQRRFQDYAMQLILSGHSGGGSFIFGYLNAVETIPEEVERIAFLDATYGYDPAQRHEVKLAQWLKSSEQHYLSVLAYHDSVALLDGKPFVSATGGTWYRSQLMQTNLASSFTFAQGGTEELRKLTALGGRISFLLKANPERKIWHTVQVERNGFMQAMLSGTPLEERGYTYFGPRAYDTWIGPPAP
jgi:hypothetical protein